MEKFVVEQTTYMLIGKEYWDIYESLEEILRDCAYEVHYNGSLMNEHTKHTLMRCIMSAQRIKKIIG